MGSFSIHRQFDGSVVLLTGATGYVGQLVLEKLLRCTGVSKVYILLRPKRGDPIQTRVDALFKSPVFHLLRGTDVLDKVVPIAGNMLASGLGVSLADRVQLRSTTCVIHCAADIRLEAGIKELLQANYEGTRQLLDIATTMPGLNAFVHVSSAYVNMNAHKGSLVKEAIYPLHYGDSAVDDYELVQELLSMPAHNANSRSEGLMKAWNFPNNYTLSKHLTEYMVADYHKFHKLPIAIVRPTLISSVARDPYPGYTGNYAGHVGATLAFMAGLFDSPEASNYKGGNVWDVIPADVVVADILAAAAAVGAGIAASCCATKTINGRLSDSSYAQQQASTGRSNGSSHSKSRSSATIALQAFAQGVEAATVKQQQQQAQQDDEPLLIIHCGSSTLYPLTIMESWNWGIEAYGAWPTGHRLCRGCAAPLTVDHEPNAEKSAQLMAWTGWKVWAASTLLRWAGQEKVAKKLSVGFESFRVINQPKTDVNLRFSTSNMQKLASKLDPSEREEFLLLWKPQVDGAVPHSGAAVVPGAAPRFGLTAAAAAAAGGAAAGKEPAAGGHHHDTLLPSIDEAGVIKAKLMLTSSGGSSRCASVDGEVVTSGSGSDTELHTSDGEDSGSSSSSPKPASRRPVRGAKLGPEQQEALARMQAIPIQWRDFHINLGAFLYCSVFRMPEPAQLLPITKEQVLNWLHIKPDDAWVRHQFKLYR